MLLVGCFRVARCFAHVVSFAGFVESAFPVLVPKGSVVVCVSFLVFVSRVFVLS